MDKPDSPSQRNAHGKVFERFVDNCFRPLTRTHPCEWERVLDSAAAGNVVRSADADFKLQIHSGYIGRPWRFYIECKSSVKHESLSSCLRSMVKPHQMAKLRLAYRSGAVPLILFENQDQLVEIWYAKDLFDVYSLKRVAVEELPAKSITKKNFPRFAENLVTQPKIFIQQDCGVIL